MARVSPNVNERAPRVSPLSAPRVIAAVVLALGVAACSDDSDDPQLPVVDVGDDLVGTCLRFPADTGGDIDSLPSIDCAEEHSHEVIAVLRSKATTYPGFEALETEAQAACLAEFEDYVGVNPFDSQLFTEWLVPTLTSWDQADDREIICVAGNHDGAPLVGSVEGVRR